MKSKKVVVIGIIVVIVVVLFIIFNQKSTPETSEEIAKCIGEKSTLYVQLGCSACKIQEDMFGKYYKHLDKVDCFFNSGACKDKTIESTPTWIIKNEKYKGVQNITTLQQLTGC